MKNLGRTRWNLFFIVMFGCCFDVLQGMSGGGYTLGHKLGTKSRFPGKQNQNYVSPIDANAILKNATRQIESGGSKQSAQNADLVKNALSGNQPAPRVGWPIRTFGKPVTAEVPAPAKQPAGNASSNSVPSFSTPWRQNAGMSGAKQSETTSKSASNSVGILPKSTTFQSVGVGKNKQLAQPVEPLSDGTYLGSMFQEPEYVPQQKSMRMAPGAQGKKPVVNYMIPKKKVTVDPDENSTDSWGLTEDVSALKQQAPSDAEIEKALRGNQSTFQSVVTPKNKQLAQPVEPLSDGTMVSEHDYAPQKNPMNQLGVYQGNKLPQVRMGDASSKDVLAVDLPAVNRSGSVAAQNPLPLVKYIASGSKKQHSLLLYSIEGYDPKKLKKNDSLDDSTFDTEKEKRLVDSEANYGLRTSKNKLYSFDLDEYESYLKSKPDSSDWDEYESYLKPKPDSIESYDQNNLKQKFILDDSDVGKSLRSLQQDIDSLTGELNFVLNEPINQSSAATSKKKESSKNELEKKQQKARKTHDYDSTDDFDVQKELLADEAKLKGNVFSQDRAAQEAKRRLAGLKNNHFGSLFDEPEYTPRVTASVDSQLAQKMASELQKFTETSKGQAQKSVNQEFVHQRNKQSIPLDNLITLGDASRNASVKNISKRELVDSYFDSPVDTQEMNSSSVHAKSQDSPLQVLDASSPLLQRRSGLPRKSPGGVGSQVSQVPSPTQVVFDFDGPSNEPAGEKNAAMPKRFNGKNSSVVVNKRVVPSRPIVKIPEVEVAALNEGIASGRGSLLSRLRKWFNRVVIEPVKRRLDWKSKKVSPEETKIVEQSMKTAQAEIKATGRLSQATADFLAGGMQRYFEGAVENLPLISQPLSSVHYV